MVFKYLWRDAGQITGRVSLQTVLIVPFVIQIFAAVGLTGYFSLSQGRKAVSDFATQLSQEVSERIEQHVLDYLRQSHTIHQALAGSIESGSVNLNEGQELKNYFWYEVQRLESLSYVYLANPQGEFIGVQQLADGQMVVHRRDASSVPFRHTYLLDAQGNQTGNLIASREYDPRVRSWYQRALKVGKPTWSPIYQFAASDYKILGISPVTPLTTPTGTLQAVLASDLSLAQISDFLRTLKISPQGFA